MKSDTGPFSITPEWVLDSGISDRACRLYAVLGRYADQDGTSWPSRRTLAARLDCSDDSIDRAKQELVDVGALLWERRKDENGSLTSNLYTLIRAAPVRLPTRKAEERGTRKAAAKNENQLEREPLGHTAASGGPDERVQKLVSGYVDDYRLECNGHEPPRHWRGAAGKAVKTALKDGESLDAIARCLAVTAREGKNPSTLQNVLSDYHANRPRRTR